MGVPNPDTKGLGNLVKFELSIFYHFCSVPSVQGCPGDALPLCPLALRTFSLGPHLCASGPCKGIEEAGAGPRAGECAWVCGCVRVSVCRGGGGRSRALLEGGGG